MLFWSFASFSETIRIIYPSRLSSSSRSCIISGPTFGNVEFLYVTTSWITFGLSSGFALEASSQNPLIACGIFKDFKASWNRTTLFSFLPSCYTQNQNSPLTVGMQRQALAILVLFIKHARLLFSINTKEFLTKSSVIFITICIRLIFNRFSIIFFNSFTSLLTTDLMAW